MCLARRDRSQRAVNDFLINGCEFVARSRKESRDSGITVSDALSARRLQPDLLVFFGQPVEAFGVRALTSHRPEAIRQVLLDERYLGLNRQLNIAQICLSPAIWRHAGQHPGAAFLIHQAARAIDRIDNDSPDCIFFRRS